MAQASSKDTKEADRHSRILSAALEVFSKSSFSSATTAEIARRARISKRDLYATFPDKHAILTEVIQAILKGTETKLQLAISDSQAEAPSLASTLEIIGLVLVSEILSPLEGFVCRLAFAESVENPPIGRIYFENWYRRRVRIVADTLSGCSAPVGEETVPSADRTQASMHFMALVTHLPQLTVSFGTIEMWNPKSVQDHVRNAVQCFLRAYPAYA